MKSEQRYSDNNEGTKWLVHRADDKSLKMGDFDYRVIDWRTLHPHGDIKTWTHKFS